MKNKLSEEDIIERFSGNGPCNYSETGAKLEFTHNLRLAVESLSRSTTKLSIIIIILTIIMIVEVAIQICIALK